MKAKQTIETMKQPKRSEGSFLKKCVAAAAVGALALVVVLAGSMVDVSSRLDTRIGSTDEHPSASTEFTTMKTRRKLKVKGQSNPQAVGVESLELLPSRLRRQKETKGGGDGGGGQVKTKEKRDNGKDKVKADEKQKEKGKEEELTSVGDVGDGPLSEVLLGGAGGSLVTALLPADLQKCLEDVQELALLLVDLRETLTDEMDVQQLAEIGFGMSAILSSGDLQNCIVQFQERLGSVPINDLQDLTLLLQNFVAAAVALRELDLQSLISLARGALAGDVPDFDDLANLSHDPPTEGPDLSGKEDEQQAEPDLQECLTDVKEIAILLMELRDNLADEVDVQRLVEIGSSLSAILSSGDLQKCIVQFQEGIGNIPVNDLQDLVLLLQNYAAGAVVLRGLDLQTFISVAQGALAGDFPDLSGKEDEPQVEQKNEDDNKGRFDGRPFEGSGFGNLEGSGFGNLLPGGSLTTTLPGGFAGCLQTVRVLVRLLQELRATLAEGLDIQSLVRIAFDLQVLLTGDIQICVGQFQEVLGDVPIEDLQGLINLLQDAMANGGDIKDLQDIQDIVANVQSALQAGLPGLADLPSEGTNLPGKEEDGEQKTKDENEDVGEDLIEGDVGGSSGLLGGGALTAILPSNLASCLQDARALLLLVRDLRTTLAAVDLQVVRTGDTQGLEVQKLLAVALDLRELLPSLRICVQQFQALLGGVSPEDLEGLTLSLEDLLIAGGDTRDLEDIMERVDLVQGGLEAGLGDNILNQPSPPAEVNEMPEQEKQVEQKKKEDKKDDKKDKGPGEGRLRGSGLGSVLGSLTTFMPVDLANCLQEGQYFVALLREFRDTLAKELDVEKLMGTASELQALLTGDLQLCVTQFQEVFTAIPIKDLDGFALILQDFLAAASDVQNLGDVQELAGKIRSYLEGDEQQTTLGGGNRVLADLDGVAGKASSP